MVFTSQDAREFKHFLSKQVKKADEAFGFSDEQCLQLIDLYLLGNKDAIGVPLHVCVNRPPCVEGEKEETYRHGRKWCKGSKLPIGSIEFLAKAQTIVQTADMARAERLESAPKATQKEAQETATMLEGLSVRYNKLLEKASDQRDDLEERLQKLQEQATPSHPEMQRKEAEFKRDTLKNQARQAKLKASGQVLTLVREVTEDVSEFVRVEQHKRQESETKLETSQLQATDTSTAQALQQMSLMLAQVIKQQQDQSKELRDLRDRQEYTNRAARKTLGEEYWNDQLTDLLHQGVWGIAKEAVKTPFRMFNITLWQPAKFWFWQTFGKWFYYLWGFFAFMILLLCVLSFYRYMDQNFPDWLGSLMKIVTYMWTGAVEAGSIMAKAMKPIFGDTFMWLMEGVGSGATTLWDWTIGKLWEQVMQAFWASMPGVGGWFSTGSAAAGTEAVGGTAAASGWLGSLWR